MFISNAYLLAQSHLYPATVSCARSDFLTNPETWRCWKLLFTTSLQGSIITFPIRGKREWDKGRERKGDGENRCNFNITADWQNTSHCKAHGLSGTKPGTEHKPISLPTVPCAQKQLKKAVFLVVLIRKSDSLWHELLPNKGCNRWQGKANRPVPFLGAACSLLHSVARVKRAVQPLHPFYHNALHYPFLLALGSNNKEIRPKTNAEFYSVADAWNKPP